MLAYSIRTGTPIHSKHGNDTKSHQTYIVRALRSRSSGPKKRHDVHLEGCKVVVEGRQYQATRHMNHEKDEG